MKIDIAKRQLYHINMKNQTQKTEEKVYTAREVYVMLERIDNALKKIITDNKDSFKEILARAGNLSRSK